MRLMLNTSRWPDDLVRTWLRAVERVMKAKTAGLQVYLRTRRSGKRISGHFSAGGFFYRGVWRPADRIVMTLPPTATRADLTAVYAHELEHFLQWHNRQPFRERPAYVQAVRACQALGLDPPEWALRKAGMGRPTREERARAACAGTSGS